MHQIEYFTLARAWEGLTEDGSAGAARSRARPDLAGGAHVLVEHEWPTERSKTWVWVGVPVGVSAEIAVTAVTPRLDGTGRMQWFRVLGASAVVLFTGAAALTPRLY